MKSIEEICNEYNITNYTINNGLVDVNGDVDLYNKGLTKLPLNFGSVSGDFNCSYNNLTNLEGSPENIGGSFYCLDNPIGSIFNNVDIDFIRAFNIFKVIKGDKVNLKRLKYVMSLFNLPINLEKIKQYYEID